MDRVVRLGLVCLGVVLSTVVVTSSGALGKSSTASCSSYKGGAGRLVDAFTQVRVVGVSCRRAHEVLGTWANSGPGGTDLGFLCHAKQTHKTTVFDVRCVEGDKRIAATDTEKT